jgi:hypothetical protein
MYYVVRTQLYLKKWYIEYYTINYMFRPLYICHPQVFLKLNELRYKQYGVLWGDEISFTIFVGMNQNFEMESFISAAVFCRGAPWNTFCVLVKPGRLLCVSVILMGCP